MLPATLEGSPVPGVDVACNAMYLSLVGDTPEVYCPPGCTLQATTQGTIYVLDHVRRIGYTLQLAPVSNTLPVQHAAVPLPTHVEPVALATAPAPHPHRPPPMDASSLLANFYPSPPPSVLPHVVDGTAALDAVGQHKRSRASSVNSYTPSSSYRGLERHHRSSPEPLMDPTAPLENGTRDGNDNYDDDVSSSSPRSAQMAVSLKRPGFTLQTHPEYCLIPSRPQWRADLFFTLQISPPWPHGSATLLYCHYCRTFFSAKPTGMWQHLSNPRGHRLQRQRVRGYLVSGNQLLNTPEKRMLRVATPHEIRTVPQKHFQHADRLQTNTTCTFVPACVRWRSMMSQEQRDRVVSDGAALAAKAITREDLSSPHTEHFREEPPQLVGWRFLMEGLDVVECHCTKTRESLRDFQLLSHHKSS